MMYDNIKEAAHAWVNSFNAIPTNVVEKLMKQDADEVREITPIRVGDGVYILSGTYAGEYGEVIETRYHGQDDMYYICLDGTKVYYVVERGDNIEHNSDDGLLPIWGTMWAFGDGIDDEWLDGEYLGSHLQEMADCGFRIYENEDYGYIFGIDGAGYDFYEAHWIPLYKARGLHWHKSEEDA